MFFQWRPSPNRQLPGVFAASLIGGVAGFVSALVGIAGGNILVPTLTYFNVATHNATATASVLGLPLAAVGALSYGLSAADLDTPTKMLGWIDLEGRRTDHHRSHSRRATGCALRSTCSSNNA